MSNRRTPDAAERYSVNCTLMMDDIPILDRPRRVRDAGLDAVEFWWPFASPVPAKPEIEAFTTAILDAGTRLIALNVYAGDMAQGGRGIVSSPGRDAEFADAVAAALEIGGEMGCTRYTVLYGNRVHGQSAERQFEIAIGNLVVAAHLAETAGATLLIEPVSGAASYPLRTAEDVMRVVDAANDASGVGNVAMLADLYHLHRNGDDVVAVISRHGARFGHVQMADSPGRGAPGTGRLPIAEWQEQCRSAGYDGFFGLEYSSTADDALAWLAEAR